MDHGAQRRSQKARRDPFISCLGLESITRVNKITKANGRNDQKKQFFARSFVSVVLYRRLKTHIQIFSKYQRHERTDTTIQGSFFYERLHIITRVRHLS